MMKAKKNFVNVLSTGILSIVGRKLNLEKHDLHVTTMRKLTSMQETVNKKCLGYVK